MSWPDATAPWPRRRPRLAPLFTSLYPGGKDRLHQRRPAKEQGPGTEPRRAAHRLFPGQPPPGLEFGQPAVRLVRPAAKIHVSRRARCHGPAAAAGLSCSRLSGRNKAVAGPGPAGRRQRRLCRALLRDHGHFHFPEHLGLRLPGRGHADRPVHAGPGRRRRLDQPPHREEASGSRSRPRAGWPGCSCSSPS